MQIDPKVEEIMDFFEFSLRSDASFTGAISFHLQFSDNSTQSFTIRVCGEKCSKKAIATYGIEQPTTVVSMSVDDFFLVYSGKVSAFELTKMFFQHRIVIENHDFSKVKSFASSFDYSTSKWDEFYSVMDKQKGCYERCNRIFSFTIPFYRLNPVFNKFPLTRLNTFFKFPLFPVHSFFPHSIHTPYKVSFDYYKSSVPPFLWRVRNQCFPTIEDHKTQSKTAKFRDDILSEVTYIETQKRRYLQEKEKKLLSAEWYFREMAFLRPYTLSESVFQNSLFDVTNGEAWHQMIHDFKGNFKTVVGTVRSNWPNLTAKDMIATFFCSLIGYVED